MMRKKTDDNIFCKKEKNGTNNNVVKSKSQINAEYFQALEQWLKDVQSYRYSCNFFSGLPYAIIGQQNHRFFFQNENNIVPPNPLINNDLNMFTHSSMRPPQLSPQQQPRQQQQQHQEVGEEGIEYTIPPFWKRFVAELVDFILLFTLKIAIVFVAADKFKFFEADENDFQLQYQLDYKVAVEFLCVEILFKCCVCLYEAYFLRKGMSNEMGGATPGKTFMGIRVVLCSTVEAIPDRPNVVKVYPATDLGLSWAFARAVLKNLVLALLLPYCFIFLLNTHNRTTYDILCHCIVVEDRVEPNNNR